MRLTICGKVLNCNRSQLSGWIVIIFLLGVIAYLKVLRKETSEIDDELEDGLNKAILLDDVLGHAQPQPRSGNSRNKGRRNRKEKEEMDEKIEAVEASKPARREVGIFYFYRFQH